MAFLYSTVLALLLLLTSKGLAEMAEDRELENLLASLDSIAKREEPQDTAPDTTMDLPETLIDNVDHMKEERKLSGQENSPNENAENDEPQDTAPDTTMDFPETLIDNVDHMKEERKLSGQENSPNENAENDAVDASYEPVGCYRDYGDRNRPLPFLLANLRSQIDWHDLNKTIRACGLLAKAKGYTYFGIQFYGECWSGANADQTYNKDGPSDRCVAGVGQTWANFVYRLKADECSKYIELDAKDRSENNNGADGIFGCDNSLTPGWYRFTGSAGTHLATKCPPRFHCSAHAPGWMSGTLPSKAEGAVDRKVCFHWRNDCCYWDTNIMVKNCGGYYIYKLQKPPYCRLKYCGSSTSAKKRTFTMADIPEATTNGLQKLVEDSLAYRDAERPKDSTSRSLHEGTEMDMFLGNGNDDVLDEYEQVGCYHDRGGDNRSLPILLANLRSQIDWHNLNKTVRMCASIAQAKGYRYFGIQFYGECRSGPNVSQTYDKDGASPNGCVAGVGKAGSNYVYRFVEEEKTTVSPTTSGKPTPVECTQYTELKSAQRSINYGASGIYTCDSNLTPGWYRFTGSAGTHMATKCPPRFHCGAHAPGWMNGTLPSKAEGAVDRKVCFHWRNDCCYWDTMTMVRNCGGYYIYKLQKPPLCRLKYCGNGKETSTEEPPITAETTTTTTVRPTTTQPTTTEVATPNPGDECTNYDVLDSADRSENHDPNGIFTCDKDLTPGWYRFTGQAGTQMATKCPQILQCGTHAPGWMSGTLPSVAERVVKRKVCFHWRDDCCYYDTKVSVRNCGGFFVYNLPKPPVCRLKYCGNNPALPTTSKPMTTLPTTRPPPPTTSPIPKKTFRLCEHRSGVLRCPPGQKIKIHYANYGRTEGRGVCPHRSIRTTHCYSSVAASLIRCACNGHNSCPLYAKNQVYGDPCVGTFKYIEIKYQCLMQSMEGIAMR